MSIGGNQTFTVRCGKCIKNQSVIDRLKNGVNRGNIVFISRTKGLGVKVKCLVCGHTSIRYSKAARRLK